MIVIVTSILLLISSCIAYSFIKSKASSSFLSSRIYLINNIKKCSSSKNTLCLHGLGLGGNNSKNKNVCNKCSGKGAVNCVTCAGKGIDKVNGSILERWTCKSCKGFGYKPCGACNASSKGLTPEQTGER